jgi:hypothetical protein
MRAADLREPNPSVPYVACAVIAQAFVVLTFGHQGIVKRHSVKVSNLS